MTANPSRKEEKHAQQNNRELAEKSAAPNGTNFYRRQSKRTDAPPKQKNGKQRRQQKPAPEQRSEPLKVEAATKPELIEPLKRAMSSDLIPVDESPKAKDSANDQRVGDTKQTMPDPRRFSIMDDGWGI